MSQENNSNPRNGGGQGRQEGGNRNRNRNRNGNRNRKRPNQGGGQGGNRPSNQGGGNRQGGNRPPQGGGQGRQSGGGPRRRPTKSLPLTFWEKVKKFFGLYKEPTRPPRRESPAKKAAKTVAKSNTRNARGKGDEGQNSGPIKAKGQGAGASGKDFPVETPRLYLGNLSYDASEQDLEELFKGIGTVRSVEIIYNRHTHRSKGYGFLEMLTVEEAKRAVEELHDKPFMGRNLIVNGANAKPAPDADRPPREPRERKPQENKARDSKPANDRGERGEKRGNNPSRLRIKNISFDADESSLEEHFKGIGNVRRVELVYNNQTHRSKGFGFVEMQKAADAQRAIEVLHDQPFMGRNLVVTAVDEKPQDDKPQDEKPLEEKPAAEEAPKEEKPEEKPAEEPAAEIKVEPAPEVTEKTEETPVSTAE